MIKRTGQPWGGNVEELTEQSVEYSTQDSKAKPERLAVIGDGDYNATGFVWPLMPQPAFRWENTYLRHIQSVRSMYNYLVLTQRCQPDPGPMRRMLISFKSLPSIGNPCLRTPLAVQLLTYQLT